MWWLWVGIFALVALLMYVAMHAFSTSSGAPVAKADQGIEADPGSLQDPPPTAPKPRKSSAPVPAPTVTLQGYSKTVPGPTVKIPVLVPGPTVVVTPPASTVTKTITPKPAPTVTKIRTIRVPVPGPTVTETITVEVPGPTVTETITTSSSPSGGE